MVATLQKLVHKAALSEAVGMLPLQEKDSLGSDQQLQIAYLIHTGAKPCILIINQGTLLMRMFVLLKNIKGSSMP